MPANKNYDDYVGQIEVCLVPGGDTVIAQFAFDEYLSEAEQGCYDMAGANPSRIVWYP